MSPAVSFRLSTTTKRHLEELAAEVGKKPGQLAREVLEDYLAKH